MQLPSRLAASTLGDLLGALHRTRVSGVVELDGRHRISLVDGLVADVESDVARGEGLRAKLERLFAIADATVRFYVARSRPAGPRLSPRDFLHGRPRARDRMKRPRTPERDDLALARATLGVDANATVDDVRRVFRKLAKELHPDRAGAGAEARFAALSAAYHRLTAA